MKKQRLPKKTILGLTGSFGTGKTTVAKILRSFGAEVIDADKIAHNCVQVGSRPYKEIVALFGKGILRKNGLINRRRLGEIVFANRPLLNSLNEIIHPEVTRRISARLKESKSKVIVIDAPLLIEAGLSGLLDKLIVVKAGLRNQIKRAALKTSLKREEILRRIKCQLSLREKSRLADFIIDNNGSIKETKEQLIQIRRKLWKN